MTVLAMGYGSSEEYVVKIADSPPAMSAVRQETAALQRLVNSPLAEQAPKIILGDTPWQNCLIQAQSVVAANSFRQSTHITPEHFAFLTQLSRLDRRSVVLSQTDLWRGLVEKMELVEKHDLPAAVVRGFAALKQDGFADVDVAVHRTHGDFAAWNLRRADSKIVAVDWEDSESQGVFYTDLLYCLYSRWEVSSRITAADMLDEQMAACRELAGLSGLSHAPVRVVLLVWLLNRYLSTGERQVVLLLEQLWKSP